MSSLIKYTSEFKLTNESLAELLKRIKNQLRGRVLKVFVFGSASSGEFRDDSDIDLILVVENSSVAFVQRSLEFKDLFDIYPDLDILVYTPAELEAHLEHSQVGFWKSVRETLTRIL